MKLRNLAGTALLGVGAIAALNTGLRYEGELESPPTATMARSAGAG